MLNRFFVSGMIANCYNEMTLLLQELNEATMARASWVCSLPFIEQAENKQAEPTVLYYSMKGSLTRRCTKHDDDDRAGFKTKNLEAHHHARTRTDSHTVFCGTYVKRLVPIEETTKNKKYSTCNNEEQEYTSS